MMDKHIERRLLALLRDWHDKKVAGVNHKDVRKQVYDEVEISAGYFFILTVANLIALSGLITNSSPVIIGAMLISPLMGPILSFGFAFITGDKGIWERSLRKIALSVVLTIIIAAAATFLSPMKDVTAEITSRTKPHLYDLMVAFLAGTVGAVAMCTRKSYLTIVPGVAIATAVIPPLSVAGFGLGSGYFSISLGGFFLFFTNFVAIIITTCVVFYFYGFKPAVISGTDVENLKKRMSYLVLLLFVISIPLIYTLYTSISAAHLRRGIEIALKHEFNKEKRSKLSAFEYAEKNGKLDINAVVNTIQYFSEIEMDEIRKDISDALKRDVTLNVEEVKVHPAGLREDVLPAPVQVRPPHEIVKVTREEIVPLVRRINAKVEQIIAPSVVDDFYVGFHERSQRLAITLKIRRDIPLTGEEKAWLGRLLSTELNVPVDLSVEELPFVPPLVFEKNTVVLSDEMTVAIGYLRSIYKKSPEMRVSIESHQSAFDPGSKRRRLAAARASAVEDYLFENIGIPREKLVSNVGKRVKKEMPYVTLSVNRDTSPEDGK